MKRTLLLGGAGFIGSALARRLVEDGHTVTVVDDFSRGARDRLPAGIRVIPADVRTPGWRIGLRNEGTDWLFCLAGVVGVPNVESAPFRTWEVTTHAVMAALEIPAAKRFFASTSEVYGYAPPAPSERVAVSVPDVLAPRAVYALAKLWGEQAFIHRGEPYCIGRFHNVYGPAMGTDHVIPRFCLQLLNGEPLHVDDPTAIRAFCYIDDAVEAILQAMAVPTSEVFNIGNPTEPVTMEALMGRLKRIAGQAERPVTEGHNKPGFPRVRVPEIARLWLMTGFTPRVSLDEGLARTYAAGKKPNNATG